MKNTYFEEQFKKARAHQLELNTNGEAQAYWCYERSLFKKANELILDDNFYTQSKEDYKDFVEALKKAGVQELAVVSKSTALMDVLHNLADEGCEMVGLCKVQTEDWFFGEKSIVYLNGIKIKIQ